MVIWNVEYSISVWGIVFHSLFSKREEGAGPFLNKSKVGDQAPLYKGEEKKRWVPQENKLNTEIPEGVDLRLIRWTLLTGLKVFSNYIIPLFLEH